jgi:hypothetical protein
MHVGAYGWVVGLGFDAIIREDEVGWVDGIINTINGNDKARGERGGGEMCVSEG